MSICKYFTNHYEFLTGTTTYFSNLSKTNTNGYSIAVQLERIRNDLFEKNLTPFFITLGGSYMHGFESPKSDMDFRAVHIAPHDKFLGLSKITNVIEEANPDDPTDKSNNQWLVSYEIGQFCNQLLKMNCNMLEQLFADSIVIINPKLKREFFELQMYVKNMLSKKGLFDSYNGLMTHNYKKYIVNDNHVTNKKYLYIIKNGLSLQNALALYEIEPNINKILDNDIGISLNYSDKAIDIIRQLIKRKKDGLGDDDVLTIKKEDLDGLVNEIFVENSEYYDNCQLQEKPSDFQRDILEDWLIDFRKSID